MIHQKTVNVGDIPFGGTNKLAFILGPCQIESRDHAMFLAERIAKICENLGVRYIYKSSYDKANRSSIASPRGVGIEEGLKILQEVRETFNCPTLTDVHEVSHCAKVAEAVDVLQIPAFLSRQTDLLQAAAVTGKAVNVKKGQFLSPWEISNVVDKITCSGNENILLCERGTSFGYNNLINDFRGLEVMAETGFPVIFDATHSVQQPGANLTSSGGERRFVATLARAACAVGVAGVFLETHQEPENAPCDGPNMIQIDHLLPLMKQLIDFDIIRKAQISADNQRVGG